MAQQINAPRGMRDFLPVEKAKREELIQKAKAAYLARGFQEIETPILEDLNRLQSGQGGDNEKLVFKVQKRGEEFTEALAQGAELADLGLRFDLTVPLTRYFASNQGKLPRVLKAIQTGPVFRAERPQKGRYRQFIQCDIDIIGEDSMLAEFELISASLAALEAMGVSGATIRVNHRELLLKSIADLGVSPADALSAMISIDKLDKIGIDGVCEELGEKFGAEVAKQAASWLSSLSALDTPEQLKSLFETFGKKLRYDPTLVRGMGYYTGTIFEIEHPHSSSSIGGGGRYDGMVGKWLGVNVPAVGISLGIERIVDLVPDTRPQTPALVLLVSEEQSYAMALQAQQGLLANWRVRIDRKPKNVKALLTELSEQGFSHFAFLGESGEVDIKPIS
ncbi:MAG: histidine--tRNA ligase [Actinobacteria bacterium]|nr:histidine--tRNA ligase [Actinomycetota bacterium]